MLDTLYHETQQPGLNTGLPLKLNSILTMSENHKKDVGHNSKVNLIGESFGRLLVIAEGKPVIRVNKKKRRTWVCLCSCGVIKTIAQTNLVSGNSLSCGCRKLEALLARCTTHGCATYGACTTEYKAWQAMINRCTNKRYVKFHLYGGRGIKVCDRWLFGENGKSGFECFLEDMGLRPPDKHTLDRIDSNGNYEPSNCRWATWTEQQNNRSNNVRVEWQGRTQTVAQWEHELGFRTNTLSQRLRKPHWTVERAFTEPVKA